MSFSAIHPINLDVLEKGNYPEIESKKSQSLSRKISKEIRASSSCPSLSAELVEAVLHDGQYRFLSEETQEVAMWCGLGSFLILGVTLVTAGLFMALS